MVAKRQDAWTSEDDLILAEVTLRHIREGSTQLLAFEEVAEKLGRTPAACGFRWNSDVRKKYDAAIQIAKSQRQKNAQARGKSARMTFTDEFGKEENLSIDSIIRFLRHYKNELRDMKAYQEKLERDLEEREEKISRLEHENMNMRGRLDHVETDYQVVNDDYKALIQIMDRARKMAFLEEQESDHLRSRFRMDSNGNLERVDK
ncbi:RsfA family transcriptional regulator [Mechercharimyces sp. CAU 1602]|uniref:RsfA family transcriptional regulator n=1 Tax=Mechercharimyces sp. CAU 1602 TaxID=2973933 RepID=UPI002162359F|nr:RsfA family transcriptional regulator [Mechercharimyces sp. CAU 1602]MCS1350604.1 RsfA family transcriptional regulator [Mechercharimyces sp. CAU 1602]